MNIFMIDPAPGIAFIFKEIYETKKSCFPHATKKDGICRLIALLSLFIDDMLLSNLAH